LYKRTLVAGVPSDTSYVIYKQLAEKNNANTFTAVNTFSNNIVMSGTGKSLTNPGGTIGSNTANIATGITCGTVNCDNGGTNSVAAKLFATRTSGASTTGWAMKQNTPSVPAVFSDNVLQFTASQAGSFITVASSDYDPSWWWFSQYPHRPSHGGQWRPYQLCGTDFWYHSESVHHQARQRRCIGQPLANQCGQCFQRSAVQGRWWPVGA
jgi:hypothetical protein